MEQVLRETLASYEEDLIAFSEALIAIPTENPPGVAYRACADLLAQKLAERMGVQRSTVTRLFNASHPNPTLDTIADILRALGLQAEIKISPASPEDAAIPIKATFVPA